MLTLVLALYVLCSIAFYVQMMLHGKHHFESDEPLAPSQTAEIYELFPQADGKRAA